MEREKSTQDRACVSRAWDTRATLPVTHLMASKKTQKLRSYHATQKNVPAELTQAVQARRSPGLISEPHASDARRHPTLKSCDAYTPFTASGPQAAVCLSLGLTPWEYR